MPACVFYPFIQKTMKPTYSLLLGLALGSILSITACTQWCGAESCSNKNTQKACTKEQCSVHCADQKSSRPKKAIPSCSLSDTAFAKRGQELRSGLLKKVKGISELPNGYELHFKDSEDLASELLEFIRFEQGCCANFSFALVFPPDHTHIGLQLYGDKEVKEELGNALRQLTQAPNL